MGTNWPGRKHRATVIVQPTFIVDEYLEFEKRASMMWFILGMGTLFILLAFGLWPLAFIAGIFFTMSCRFINSLDANTRLAGWVSALGACISFTITAAFAFCCFCCCCLFFFVALSSIAAGSSS